MGIPDMLVQLFKEIGDHNGPFDTKEEIDAGMKRIKPVATACGVVETKCIICCPCGTPIPLQVDQPDHKDLDIDSLRADYPEADVRDLTKDVPKPPGAKTMVASNYGHTIEDCGKCGRRFIVTLEMHCANISTEVKLPWGDTEIPDRSSSGLSFNASVDDNGTVH